MKKYLKYITCLLVSLLLITTCFATDEGAVTDTEVSEELTKVDEIVVDGENLPDIRTYVSQTNIYFITQSTDGSIYLYYCPAVYTLRTNAGRALIYSYNAANNQCAMNRCIYSNNTWIPLQTTTSASTTTILYSSVDIYQSTSSVIYFAKNLESVGVGEIVIDNSLAIDEETKGVLYMILGILIFFLICVLCTYIYKFFKMFF